MATIEEIAERNALGNVLSELEYQNEQLRQRIEADEVNYKLMAEERRQALASLANAANEAEALRARVAFLTNELIGTRGALESLHDERPYNLQYQVQQMIDMINEALEAE